MTILVANKVWSAYHFKYFQNNPILKSWDRTIPWHPNFESLPYPREGGRFEFFSLKWGERVNLKVPGAILPLNCACLSTKAKTVGELLQPHPLRRTRVNTKNYSFYFEVKTDLQHNAYYLTLTNLIPWRGIVCVHYSWPTCPSAKTRKTSLLTYLILGGGIIRIDDSRPKLPSATSKT